MQLTNLFKKFNFQIIWVKTVNCKTSLVKVNMIFLTVAMFGSFDMKRATKNVDKITDANGAAADTQNSLGFRKPCINRFYVLVKSLKCRI